MIFGLEHIISAGLLALASGGAQACPATPPATVVMQTRNGTPKYYYHVPSSQLPHINTGGSKPKHLGPNYVIGGLTHGKIGTGYQIEMMAQPMPGRGTHCVSVKQITVTLDYQPDVYIASEYRPGSCHYNVTMQHEVQHVNLELITLNEFLPRFQSHISRTLASMPPLQPVTQQDLPRVREWIGAQVNTAVHQVLAQMMQVRDSRQGGIDTPQEYDRLARSCAHEPNPIRR
ncbi:MAG: hypothetical protein RBS08_04290 [Bdellovibrionales bacterium]|jgi:hypothetical protein|nr:hypothetical protein [Bdellovibrionales bacterium]